MPELPEVETVRRGLEPVMEGARIVALDQRRPDLRFPFPDDFAARVAGRRVTALARRAKYLLIHLDSGAVLICHLGMSGSFRIEREFAADVPGSFHHARPRDAKHDHVRFSLQGPKGEAALVTYNDPRRFGFMLLAEAAELDAHPLLAGLGVEPTGNTLDGALLAALLRGRQAPLKAALLDQRIVAGLGNIYVCEALWRAGLSPRRRAGSIVGEGRATGNGATARTERLAKAVRAVIAEAIAAGGSSLRDHMRADGSLGYFQHSFNAYDREGEACHKPGCDGTIRRIVQSGRSTFYCPACQR
ncbi:bifunctional DNA-formamidopyrimidine glycosylase/DNA-(apurinic or apyrimidinic site) lyase [Nitratireductor luteus]|uniref:bifunctional DNA-formamidopyrimidine glycosylase/DNA-(apurinic or apyrimidinic site) lyase n=1 Tax=Nitratireductor luteus TaxID=2976980 RepID=UPI00223FDF0A|nr:bifunctional DNA-formamidopyrimidine glycosylase/DNA-(apurinic or apyrimidinic site) lyase [Nitratireductor luteus]